MTIKLPIIRQNDLHLPDGRTLIFQGERRMQSNWAACNPRRFVWATTDCLRVAVTVSPSPHGAAISLSLSYPDREPSLAEVKAIRRLFYPSGVTCGLIIPAEEEEFCHVLYQMPDAGQ